MVSRQTSNNIQIQKYKLNDGEKTDGGTGDEKITRKKTIVGSVDGNLKKSKQFKVDFDDDEVVENQLEEIFEKDQYGDKAKGKQDGSELSQKKTQDGTSEHKKQKKKHKRN